MDVQLYVYDLSRGMARSMSQQFLGIHLDAVYHTSLVLDRVEYFFGMGIQTCRAGTTHHGKPMEVVPMGRTHLPTETILEYLESMKKIYSPESYDLFAHNCNNFTNDFAMFLVGNGIPSHITNLPKRVLDTPFGQMLKPQIDASMRSVTQAPTPTQRQPSRPATNGTSQKHHSSSPSHPHASVQAATLQFGSFKPVLYTKTPPFEKLMARLGPATGDLNSLRHFVEACSSKPEDATLPDLRLLGQHFRERVLSLPIEVRFAAVDLLRCAMVDPRVSGYFAEEKSTIGTIAAIIRHVNELEDCPHNLRLVALQLACNVFSSSLYTKELMRGKNVLAPLLIQLITSSLLDASHPTTRVAAASLSFNIASANYRVRREEDREGLSQSDQVELAASLVETLSREDSVDATKALLLAFGYLVYVAPQDGELMDLVRALDAKATIGAVKGQDALAREVASLL